MTSEGIGAASIPLLLSRGTRAAGARVPGPGGTRLGVGDRWPRATADGGMTAAIEVHHDGARVHLACREDGFNDEQWAAFDMLPDPVTVLARSPSPGSSSKRMANEPGRPPSSISPLTRDEHCGHGSQNRTPVQYVETVRHLGRCRPRRESRHRSRRPLALARRGGGGDAGLPEEQILAVLNSQDEIGCDIVSAQAMQDHLRPGSRQGSTL